MQENPNPFAAPLAVDEAPVEVWTADDPRAMRLVKTGLLLVYIAICGIILSAIGLGVFGASAATGGAGVAATGAAILGVLIVVFFVMQLIGVGLCINAPRASGARQLAVASLALQVLSLLGSFGSLFLPPANTLPGVIISASTSLMNLASVVCFLLAMWRLADHIKRPDIAGRARRTLIAGAIFGVLLLLFVVLMMFSFREQNESVMIVSGILGMVGGLGSLIAFLMYANTVTYLRKAIGEALEQTGD